MINHVTAANGGLILSYGLDRLGFGKNVEQIICLIRKYGVADEVSLSGSLWYAQHYGFDYENDAMILWNTALEEK